ncbi:hypothetical protein [Muricoccus radiodurans]|uniref:hypothetical protein n=1 Tax=Muricoccus radiodurans TaxID=2231721 RepID=UPI003CE9796A
MKQAILYARGKKQSKAVRKTFLAGTKLSLQVASVAGGATIGSAIPGAGTALGAAGGVVAGMGFGFTVTPADRIKRSAKGIYKHYKGTRGRHRMRAAACLMHRHVPAYDWACGANPADYALRIILGADHDEVMAWKGVMRVHPKRPFPAALPHHAATGLSRPVRAAPCDQGRPRPI